VKQIVYYVMLVLPSGMNPLQLPHMRTVTLEPAAPRDAIRIAQLSERVVEFGLRPAWTPRRITAAIRDRETMVLTARAERRLAGFAIMQFGDDSAHLNLLAVDPAHRRLGVGRKLLEWLEQSALVAGTLRIHLELRAGNTDALCFYSALGYRRRALVPGYYQGREDAIRMERRLGLLSAEDAP
jgi:ribosomal protein S18 acetylase RimI-like enzyme